jgi:hypothetical protein
MNMFYFKKILDFSLNFAKNTVFFQGWCINYTNGDFTIR